LDAELVYFNLLFANLVYDLFYYVVDCIGETFMIFQLFKFAHKKLLKIDPITKQEVPAIFLLQSEQNLEDSLKVTVD